MKLLIVFTFFLLSLNQITKQISIVPTNETASFRALSVVNDSVVWVAGSNGRVGRSINGGKNWTFKTISGCEKTDFRSIYAFDRFKAVIASAGSPGYILHTKNGGESWDTAYKDVRPEIFIDGIDFWDDKFGMIYGDPIDNRMFLLRTEDGGRSWHELPTVTRLNMAEGEASFAASGTGIRCMKDGRITISSGGTRSRLFHSRDYGKSWSIEETPIIQGENTTGIYSFAHDEGGNFIIVGGDYTMQNQTFDHVFFKQKNSDWTRPKNCTRGYRECVEFIGKNEAIAVGPTGIDISNDAGNTWQMLSNEQGFHVVRKARKGSLVVLAGARGKIGLLK